MRWLLVFTFAAMISIGAGITVLLAWLIRDAERLIADPPSDQTDADR